MQGLWPSVREQQPAASGSTPALRPSSRIADEDAGTRDEAVLTRLRSALKEPQPSAEALLAALCTPLDLVGMSLPPGLERYAASPSSVLRGARTTALRPPLVAEVQTALLTSLAVTWAAVLREAGQWEPLLQCWFWPTAKEDCRSFAAAIQHSTLRNMQAWLPPFGQHPETRAALRIVLDRIPAALDFTALAAEAAKETSPARSALLWDEALKSICSLETRVANWSRGGMPPAWREDAFAASIGEQSALLILARANRAAMPDTATATLFSKLAGFSSSSAFWPALLRTTLRSAPWSEMYRRPWREALGPLTPFKRRSFVEGAIGFLARKIDVGLVAASERASSQEGTLFTSAEASAKREAARAILSLFGLDARQTRERVQWADSEGEDDALNDLHSILFSGISWVKPTAMCVVLASLATDTAQAGRLAAAVLKTWGNPQRVRSDTLERSLYWTTLVILLPLPTPFDSHLLSGVSAHLEHNQPAIRRLGMLVAELVSVKAAASGATGSKPLTFGRALWDGPGDGRSEARALRRLHAAPQLVGGGVPTDAVQLLGLGASLSPPPPPPAATLPVVPRHRSAPISEALPRRVPAPQRSRPLIQALSDDELDSEISLQPSTGSKPLVSRMSDWSSSSSSEDNSSSSSGDEMPLGGLEELGIGPDAIPGLSKPKDEEEFGMGVPKKKRRRTPVYVGELAPLLREQDRSANRLGLKSAASLLRRKRGWGGEIDDNAVDLAFALCGMQDNYSLKAFETRRGQALSALLVASPRLAAPAIIEQFFHHQYSQAQRSAMLIALATATRELSGLAPMPDALPTVEALAEDLTHAAAMRAREEGEAREPAIQKEKALRLGRAQTRLSAVTARSAQSTLPGAVVRPTERYADLAGSAFLFPLIGHTWRALESVGSRGRTAAGAGGLLAPSMVSRLLDTLAVMSHAARHAPPFRAQLVPELLELVLAVCRTPLQDSEQASLDSGREAVAGSAASLALVLLDAVWELDGGASLFRGRIGLLIDVGDWAQQLFAREDSRGQSAAAMGRAGRASAALLLRIHEMRSLRQGG